MEGERGVDQILLLLNARVGDGFEVGLARWCLSEAHGEAEGADHSEDHILDDHGDDLQPTAHGFDGNHLIKSDRYEFYHIHFMSSINFAR